MGENPCARVVHDPVQGDMRCTKELVRIIFSVMLKGLISFLVSGGPQLYALWLGFQAIATSHTRFPLLFLYKSTQTGVYRVVCSGIELTLRLQSERWAPLSLLRVFAAYIWKPVLVADGGTRLFVLYHAVLLVFG